VQTQLDLSIEVEPGVVNSVRGTTRIWLDPGLGSIRSETTLPTGTDVRERTRDRSDCLRASAGPNRWGGDIAGL